MGLAPVHYWLPDAHSEAPSPISALLSATLLNSAFLVIIRVFKIMEIASCSNYAKVVFLIMGFISLFVTAVFVYHIKNYKRMLAYSSIENMGILTIGMALGGFAYYAVILHLIGHSLAKASFSVTELFYNLIKTEIDEFANDSETFVSGTFCCYRMMLYPAEFKIYQLMHD